MCLSKNLGQQGYMFKNLDENKWKKFQQKNFIKKSFLGAHVERKTPFGT